MRRLLVALVVILPALAGCGAPRQDRDSVADPASDANQTAAAPVAAEAATVDPGLQPPSHGYNIREGRALYSYYCATCHGDEGHGDGLNAYNLDPKPRDLADPSFQKDRTDDELAGVIRSGGGVSGLSTAMPPWGRTLGDRKIREIVDYLRTLPESTD